MEFWLCSPDGTIRKANELMLSILSANCSVIGYSVPFV